MISGATPARAPATNLAIGLTPSSLAFSSDIRTSAAAPSLIPEALPAVTYPSGLIALIRARPSAVIPSRGPSSVSNTIVSFIPVEPEPPKKKAEKQPPKKPQSVQKAQPAQKQPAQKPQPAKPQPAKPQPAQKPPVQKPVEPRVREQAGEARAPRLAQSIPAPSKRAVRETAFTRMKG